jgi:hypothetical protein
MAAGTYADAVALAQKLRDETFSRTTETFLNQDIWKRFAGVENAALFANSLRTDPCSPTLDALNLRFWTLVHAGVLRTTDGSGYTIPNQYSHLWRESQAAADRAQAAIVEEKKNRDVELRDFVKEFHKLSAAQCAERFRTDPQFRQLHASAEAAGLIWAPIDAQEFERRQKERAGETAAQAVASVGLADLEKFRDEYRVTPHAVVQRSYQRDPEFRKNFDRCVAAGLI